MSIKKNNSKKIGLIASTIIHLIVFILLTLPFMSLTYLDPPKQRTGGISINFGESEDLLPSNTEEVKDQNQSNNTNQKKSNSSKKKINSENNKTSHQNTNRPKNLALDNNSNNPSAYKSIYDDLFAKAQDKKNAEEEQNSKPKEEEEEEEEEGSSGNGGSSIGQIRFPKGKDRSVIDGPIPKGMNNIKGVICVKIFVNNDGNVLQNVIEIDELETTINDQAMQEECKKAAKKTRFEPSTNTEEEFQEALILYNFDFKEK